MVAIQGPQPPVVLASRSMHEGLPPEPLARPLHVAHFPIPWIPFSLPGEYRAHVWVCVLHDCSGGSVMSIPLSRSRATEAAAVGGEVAAAAEGEDVDFVAAPRLEAVCIWRSTIYRSRLRCFDSLRVVRGFVS